MLAFAFTCALAFAHEQRVFEPFDVHVCSSLDRIQRLTYDMYLTRVPAWPRARWRRRQR